MSDTTAATAHSKTGGLVTSTWHCISRNQRRADVIKASKTVEVIDLTDEGFLAVTNIVGCGVNRAKLDGGDKFTLSNLLEKSLKWRNWESIMLLGKSFFIKNGGMQKYT